MVRAGDVITGVIVGGIMWVILDFILSPIPILGWIISAVVAGYVAGRLGGWAAGMILALFTPLASYIIIEVLLSYTSSVIDSNAPGIAPLANGALGLLGAAAGSLALLDAFINFIFVAMGTSYGASAYEKAKGGNKKVPGQKIAKGGYSGQRGGKGLSSIDRIVLERYRAGQTLVQIANDTGLSIYDVQNVLMDLMDRGLVRLPLNQLEIRILEAATWGINIRQLAMQTGVSEQNIMWEINRLKAMALLDDTLKLTSLGYYVVMNRRY
ncbi:hypothetical protein [Stygiolobus caldivivus]|nr:hypothetical protein [Stygiolobus caldivivus]